MKHWKKISLIWMFMCAGYFAGFSQMSNLVFFSEQGQLFSVVLNGILQNPRFETNVKVTNLPGPNYKLKIIFEDNKIPDIDKNLMFQQGFETTYIIKKNNKGVYTVRFFSQQALDYTMDDPPTQVVVAYSTVPPQPPLPPTTIINQTTINNTTITNNNNSTNINNTQVSSKGDVNLNVSQGGVAVNTNTTATTAAVTPNAPPPPPPPPGNDPNDMKDAYVMPGYHGPIGCPHPISDLDFEDAKRTISSKSFEDSKLSIAKQIASSNCLFASEVKQILDLFSFESTKLDFAKFAYKYTYDRGNYYKVNNAFDFESSIEELSRCIQTSK